MRKFIAGLLLISLLLVSVSCASPPKLVTSEAPRPAPAPAPAAPPGLSLPDSGGENLPQVDEERMIVRTGEMSLVVDDIVKARDEITRLAGMFGGYVVSSWVSGEEEDMRGDISFRVADDKFEQALVELRNLAVRVKSESTSSQDVTEQYVDLEARLKNAEATEKQYLNLLEKAYAVEDILRIYDSLSQVRYQIEQIKGQMQYLERTTSLSIISVRLELASTPGGVVRAGWNALEILKSAVRGIVTFGQWLGTVVIWLAIFIPVWGTVIGIIYWRKRRKKKANPQ